MKVYRMASDIELPQQHGGVGFDIRADVDYVIQPGEVMKVGTGLIMQPPSGCWIMLALRSSLAKAGAMLANGIGVIDPSYCGPEDEVCLLIYNSNDHPFWIAAGERIAQAIVMPIIDTFVLETEKPPKQLSRGGFGSTGNV